MKTGFLLDSYGGENEGGANEGDTDWPHAHIVYMHVVTKPMNALTRRQLQHHVFRFRTSHAYTSDTNTSFYSPPTVIHCPELPDVTNTNKSSDDTHYGVDITYSCMTGYQFPESNHVIKVFDKNVTCQENATWTELPDACEG